MQKYVFSVTLVSLDSEFVAAIEHKLEPTDAYRYQDYVISLFHIGIEFKILCTTLLSQSDICFTIEKSP